jgi:PAS domain S-box-containing protein
MLSQPIHGSVADQPANTPLTPSDRPTIDELEQTRTRLLIREAQLSQAQQMAGMASWEWYFGDTAIRWSPEMFLFWGYQPGEVDVDLSRVADWTHPDDLPILQAAVATALQGDDVEMQYRRFDKAGREIFIHTIGRIVRSEAGEAIGVFGVDMNITRQKEQERQLRDLNQALERQNSTTPNSTPLPTPRAMTCRSRCGKSKASTS